MNLIKYGIASVVVTCAIAVACGGSSSSNGNGSGAGTSNSSAGTSSSTGGSSSSTGGTSSSTGGTSANHGGTSATTAGGACNTTMDPMANTCPAATTCIESMCKTQLDACTSTTGVCADYIKCATPCNCDQTCIGKCTESTACMGCFTTYINCATSKCANEVFSCLGSGGSGAGGTFNIDAGSHTCADLTACCATVTDPDLKTQCTMIAGLKVDFACGISYSEFCPD